MIKSDLVAKLQQILDSSRLSVDLYFIFKTGDIHRRYLLNPDSDLRQTLIDDFKEKLLGFCNPDNLYELYDIFNDNETADFNLYFDDIENNQIAKDIFIINKAETDSYNSDCGGLSKVHGFLIVISNGTEEVSIYKMNYSVNAVSSKKFINFVTGQGNALKIVKNDTLYMSKSIDVFRIDSDIFINNRTAYTKHFGFDAELRNRAEKGFVDLIATGGFEFSENARENAGKLSSNEMKKLGKLTKNNPIIENKNWKAVLKQAKTYAGLEYETTSTGLIKINSRNDLKVLIKILNRDYNLNEASKEKYLTKNKKLLK